MHYLFLAGCCLLNHSLLKRININGWVLPWSRSQGYSVIGGKGDWELRCLIPIPLENHWGWGRRNDWFYPLKISYTNLPRERRGRSWACSWEAEISKIPWKQIIQTMTGHKSNSNLKPLISLKGKKPTFFTYFCPKKKEGRKGCKAVGLHG